MQDCILFNEYFLAQRLNPVFDVTDDVIACFQHHVACGGKHLEWQSLSHKNWWWLGLNAVKIFSYDSKFKLKVTRWLIWKKILISLAEKAWLYANLSDLWTIQYGHFAKGFWEAFQMRTVRGRAMLPLEPWWKLREWVWTFLGHHKRASFKGVRWKEMVKRYSLCAWMTWNGFYILNNKLK